MYLKNIWKNYKGTGSYYGTGECENNGCEKRAIYFIYYKPDAFEGKFSRIDGYCSKKCAMGHTGITKEEWKRLRT